MSIVLFFSLPILYFSLWNFFFTLVFCERFNGDEPVSVTDEHCLKYKSFQIQGFRLCCRFIDTSQSEMGQTVKLQQHFLTVDGRK